MSKSGARDTGSDDNNVGVAIFGSTFSLNGGDALHALASALLQRSFAMILVINEQIVQREKAEQRGQDPPHRVRIRHFGMPIGTTLQKPERRR